MNDFEQRLKRLEEIASKLRDGRIGIDEATELFEEGVGLSRRLESELKGIEQRVDRLLSEDQDRDAEAGSTHGPADPPTEPFDAPG